MQLRHVGVLRQAALVWARAVRPNSSRHGHCSTHIRSSNSSMQVRLSKPCSSGSSHSSHSSNHTSSTSTSRHGTSSSLVTCSRTVRLTPEPHGNSKGASITMLAVPCSRTGSSGYNNSSRSCSSSCVLKT